MSERTPTTRQVQNAWHVVQTDYQHSHDYLANIAEFDRWLAQHDVDVLNREADYIRDLEQRIEQVRAEERERLIGNLRWLAKSRSEYCRLPHADEDAAIRAYHESSRLMQVLHDEHTTAEAIADLLDGSNDGMGWLPSWRWDEWRAIRAVSEQEEQ